MAKKSKKSTAKTPEFVEKLFQKAHEARKAGLEISKIAAEQAHMYGDRLTKEGKKRLDDSIAAAKKLSSSGEENLKLLEDLGRLKEAGVITESEFRQKKKEILDRV